MLKYISYLLPLLVVCLSEVRQDVNGLSDTGADIPMDNAVITVTSDVNIDVYTQSEECYQVFFYRCEVGDINCNLSKSGSVEDEVVSFYVDTRWKTRLKITTNNQTLSNGNCSEEHLSRHFKEKGNYTIHVKYGEDNSIICILQMTNTPSSTFIPIYVATAIFIAVSLMWVVFSKKFSEKLWRMYKGNQEYEPLIEKTEVAVKRDGSLIHSGLISSLGGSLTLSSESRGKSADRKSVQRQEDNKPRKERLKSLDTFRGISIVIMIFVNYGGGGYWFFSHSKWNGLTVADLVFPWFVFIMGTSMAYSFTSILRNKTPKYLIFWKVFRRSCTLFLFGLVINTNGSSSVDMKEIRIIGVLQRFALTYFITATMHMFFAKLENTTLITRKNVFRDITDYWQEWIINLLFILTHTCLTFLLDVPGCPRGYLGPGGLEHYGKHMNCTGGAASYIDRQVFGEKHIYGSPTCKEIYLTTVHHDPEGLLGTLTSCVMCFLGLQAGKILMIYKDRKSRVVRFCVWSFILNLLAGILCKFSKNDGWIPVNKNLWSLSFIFCLSGFAFILLCFCYMMIDEWKIWNGAPFYYPGMNSILLYMGHELLHNNFPISWSVPSTHASRLPLDLYGVTFWVMVATYLFYKKSFYVI